MSEASIMRRRFVRTAPDARMRLDAFVDRLQDLLVDAYSMRILAKEPKKATLEIGRGETRAQFSSRAFVGSARLARVSVIRGARAGEEPVESLAVLALPNPELGAPILHASVVLAADSWAQFRLGLAATEASCELPELDAITRSFEAGSFDAHIHVEAISACDMNPDAALVQYLDAFIAALEGAGASATGEARGTQRKFLRACAQDDAWTETLEALLGKSPRDFFTREFFDPSIV